MDDLISLLTSKDYKNARTIIKSMRDFNPAFFDSMDAYIQSLDPNSNIEELFENLQKLYPNSENTWKFKAMSHMERGQHRKAFSDLKICKEMNTPSKYVTERLMNYSFYFREFDYLLKINPNLSDDKQKFLHSFDKTLPKEDEIIFRDCGSLYSEFRKETVIKKIPDINFDNSQETMKYSLHDKLSIYSLDNLKDELKKSYTEIFKYFIDYEFKLFFLNAAKEFYDIGEIKSAAFSINTFFIIHNNQIDFISFYANLFDSERFDELKSLVEYKSDYRLTEAKEIGKIILEKFESGMNGNIEIDTKFNIIIQSFKSTLSNSINHLKEFVNNNEQESYDK